MSGIKRTPADKWFSLCVRERAEWKCERCGREFLLPYTQGLDCSHYKGRGNWGTRFEPLNAFALCYGCHSLVGNDREFFVDKKGEAAESIVLEKRNNITLGKEYKRTGGKGEIAKHYKAEYERMLELRAQGVTGRLEFTAWL